ncbi:dynein axonemal intermediate chain 2 [Schistocerca cancellata]|uniref:dynein axonemal intermediate chain 2 n=1 Tax=Schistocerca cancellata TaxID=274614 RepID=UPI002117C5EE|nr:dynein axonemal intermediate chain 2 [Schistocerca cancellata]
MDLQYSYTKKRYEFGRPYYFQDDGPKVLENILPCKSGMDDYITKNPVNSTAQYGTILAEHEVNTVRAEYDQHGMNHIEGGWPRDVNPADSEQTMRFRKKVEKDEMYIHTVLQLSHAMEHCILQNNAVNIYETYFSGDEPASIVEKSSARTVNVYRDFCKPKRPVTHIAWSPDGGSHLAVTHCNLEFQRTPHDISNFSYIWEIENPNKPQLIMKPSVPLVCLQYNPKDPHGLVSGLYSGQVAIWDVRRGSIPAETSLLEASHRDPVHNVLWLNSKTGTEFFSSATDGQVKWWDTRKMAEPTETLILDPVKSEDQSLSRALGASCLEYEGTIPTRFMIGTENGTVFGCNRKGKTPVEKIVSKYTAHIGPVYALQRNPAFVKNFITVGDWTTRIWSEDCKESAIIWTSFHRALLTDGAWSPTRYSVFCTTRMDGTLDVWDILQQQKEPCLSVKVCDDPLRCLSISDNGQMIAVGSDMGTVYLVEISENLAELQKNDKPLLTAMLDRESRREKILEARIRELRLKQKVKSGPAREAALKEKAAQAAQRTSSEAVLAQVEADFRATIENEMSAGKDETDEEEKAEEADTGDP